MKANLLILTATLLMLVGVSFLGINMWIHRMPDSLVRLMGVIVMMDLLALTYGGVSVMRKQKNT